MWRHNKWFETSQVVLTKSYYEMNYEGMWSKMSENWQKWRDADGRYANETNQITSR